MNKTIFIFGLIGILGILACTTITKENTAVTNTTKVTAPSKAKDPSPKFKAYWYNGTAEITSYTLQQARYGELREGTSSLIFVTEDFLPKIQVKADQQSSSNIPILKLNSTKKFNTGIYPYAIMQSAFYPIADNSHAIKISSSIQEWCGHVYAQLNNRTSHYDVVSHSYFQEEADEEFQLDTAILENELWTKIRITPSDLPQGELKIVPSLEFCRLKHYSIKAYEAKASLITTEGISKYTLIYPTLKRSISIQFKKEFPYEIEGWTETFISGSGNTAQNLTTTATKKARIISPYWNKNSNKDSVLREHLGLQ